MNNSVGPAARRVGRALGDLAPAAIKQPTSPPYTEVTREHVEAAGHRWPLLVDRVDLVRDGAALYARTPDNRTWALNGPARAAGHQGLEPIWRIDPDIAAAMAEHGAMGESVRLRVALTDLLKYSP